MKVKFRKLSVIYILIALIFSIVLPGNHFARAANTDYTVPAPIVTTELVGEFINTAAVQIFYKMPDEAVPDVYGFLLCKQGDSVPQDSQPTDCPDGSSLINNMSPQIRGFDTLTYKGYFYDSALWDNTTYNYYVAAYDRSGVMSEFTKATVKVEFDFFKNIKVSNTTNDSVTITWDTDVPTNSSIDYGLDDKYGQTIGATATNDDKTSFKVDLKSLQDQKTYHYRLKAKILEDDSEEQSKDKTFVFSLPLLVVSNNVVATPVSATITFETNYPSICTPSFNKKAADGTWANLSEGDPSSSSTSHSDSYDRLTPGPNTPLIPGTEYSYESSCFKTGEVENKTTFTKNFTTPCTDMTGFAINTNDYYKEAMLSWTTSSDIKGRIRYRKTATDPWLYQSYEGTSPQVLLTGMQANTLYLYEVQSGRDDASCVAKSGSFTTATAWHKLSIVKNVGSVITFRWQSNVPTKGTININQLSGTTVATTNVIDYTKDLTFDYQINLANIGLVDTIFSNSIVACASDQSAQTIGNVELKVTANAITNDNQSLQSATPTTAKFPKIYLNKSATYHPGNTITGSIQVKVCPFYAQYYNWDNYVIEYSIEENTGGEYVKVVDATTTIAPSDGPIQYELTGTIPDIMNPPALYQVTLKAKPKNINSFDYLQYIDITANTSDLPTSTITDETDGSFTQTYTGDVYLRYSTDGYRIGTIYTRYPSDINAAFSYSNIYRTMGMVTGRVFKYPLYYTPTDPTKYSQTSTFVSSNKATINCSTMGTYYRMRGTKILNVVTGSDNKCPTNGTGHY